MASLFSSHRHKDDQYGSGGRSALTTQRWKWLVAFSVLATAWTLIVLMVNPVGEFMTNDDWSFVRIVETLRSGHDMIATGWGLGGPSAIVHVLWGWLFADLFGFSLTSLRISVLSAGIVCSVAVFITIKRSGAAVFPALLGALTAIFNPLFLSQCFTFMTDITFACFAVASALFLIIGVEKSRWGYLAIGLMLTLSSILIRQIGIVLPIGLIAACIVHPAGRNLNLGKILLMIVAGVLVPWFAYEYFLSASGSTPLLNHRVIENIWRYPLEKGMPGYLFSLWDYFVYYGLGYTCFFLSPLLLFRSGEIWKFRAFRVFFFAASAILITLIGLTLNGSVDPSVIFHRNVIFNFGIGPILLKDTYILGIPRTFTLPKPIYFVMVYWAALGVGALLCLVTQFAVRLFRSRLDSEDLPPNFTSTFCILVSTAYLGIITLTGFHDRYIIPVCLFLTIWLVTDRPEKPAHPFPWRRYAPAIIALFSLGSLYVAGVRDFVEFKRAQQRALMFADRTLGTAPCNFDGGFEHNGYHCEDRRFVPNEGLSWWWVSREDYLLTLGPLPGYEIVKTFPFKRIVGKSGAVYILRRDGGSEPTDLKGSS